MRLSRRRKGLTQSVELMLLIATVTLVVTLAIKTQGLMIVEQARAAKATLLVHNADGILLSTSYRASDNPYITVDFAISNLGNRELTITGLIMPTTDSNCIYEASLNQKVSPGESDTITYVMVQNGTCDTATILPKSSLIIYFTDGVRAMSTSTDITVSPPP